MEEKGFEARKIIGNMMSPEVEAALCGATMSQAFAGGIVDLAFRHAYVDLWTRQGLDLRTRSIVTISMMIATLNRDELEIHIPAAIRNGMTLVELEEILYHATSYVGFPAAASARKIAIECLGREGLLNAEGHPVTDYNSGEADEVA